MLTIGPSGRTWMRTSESRLNGMSDRTESASRRGEAGQTLVLAAFGLTVLMLAAGLAIDMGYLRYERRRIQAAADSAALAGAADSQYSYYTTSGQIDASYNGFTNGSSCNPSNGQCISITVSSPPVSGAFQGKSNYVQATVVDPSVPTFFMRIVGLNSETISATAVAYLGNGNGCLYGLTSMGPVTFSDGQPAGFDVQAEGCGVFSNSGMALNSQIIDAGYVGCAQACTGGTITPNPVTIVPVANPLAYLQPTTYSPNPYENCGPGSMPLPFVGTSPPTYVQITPQTLSGYCGVTISQGANVEFLNPGGGVQTFNGQIQILGNATVVFDPGTYVLGGGLSIIAASYSTNLSVTGTGVTFYTAGTTASVDICLSPDLSVPGCQAPQAPPMGYSATATVAFSPPTTSAQPGAPYPGVLFFQDPGNLTTATINGNSSPSYNQGTTTLQGALYFPTATLNLLNVASSTNLTANPPLGYAMAVANQLYFGGDNNSGGVDFGNYWPSGSDPVKAAVLVQ